MSGVPKRVIEFGSDEVVYAGDYNNSQTDESDKSGMFDKFQTLSAAKVHHIVPSKKPVIMNVSDGNRRYLIFFQIISIFSFFRILRGYNEPLDHDSMTKLARKNFSDDTLKKVKWVRHMFSQWRID